MKAGWPLARQIDEMKLDGRASKNLLRAAPRGCRDFRHQRPEYVQAFRNKGTSVRVNAAQRMARARSNDCVEDLPLAVLVAAAVSTTCHLRRQAPPASKPPRLSTSTQIVVGEP